MNSGREMCEGSAHMAGYLPKNNNVMYVTKLEAHRWQFSQDFELI